MGNKFVSYGAQKNAIFPEWADNQAIKNMVDTIWEKYTSSGEDVMLTENWMVDRLYEKGLLPKDKILLAENGKVQMLRSDFIVVMQERVIPGFWVQEEMNFNINT